MFRAWPQAARVASPALNVWEDESHYVAEMELPGYALSDIEVSVIDNELTVKSSRAAEKNGDGAYLRRERRGGSFTRTVALPVDIDAENVQASLSNGVLLVTLPTAAKALPRKIAVTAAGG